MRLKNLIPLLVAFILLLPGLAFANPAGEQLILRQINVGSFEVWKHTNGQWQDTDHDGTPDIYGQANKKTRPLLYFMPRSQYTDGFEFTRAVVRHTVTEQDYNDNKTMERPDKNETWRDFKDSYLARIPDNYSITYTASEKGVEQPVVSVTRVLDLTPTVKAIDLKDPLARQKLGRDEKQFADLAEGWLWYTPITIEWYGVPKEQKFNLVASSINSGAPGKAKPNQKYTGTATFKYFGDTPKANVPIGVFNGNWPAVLKNSSGTAVTTDNFNPGDVKTYTFEWTAPKDGTVTLTGAISINPPLSSDPYPNETTKNDNKVVSGVEVEGYDIRVSMTPLTKKFWLYPEDGNAKKTLTTITVARKDKINETIPVKLTVTASGGYKFEKTFNLKPGEKPQFKYEPSLPVGTYTIKAEAWPSNTSWEDIYPPDNVAQETIKVEKIDIHIPDPENQKIRVGL